MTSTGTLHSNDPQSVTLHELEQIWGDAHHALDEAARAALLDQGSPLPISLPAPQLDELTWYQPPCA